MPAAQPSPPDPSELTASDLTTLHVRQAVAGDPRSLEWVVERFDPFLKAQVRYRLRDGLRDADVHDIVSQIWLVALRKIPDLRAREGRLAPVLVRFLATTALYTCNEYLRRSVREPRMGSSDAGLESSSGAADVPDETHGVVTRVNRSDLHAVISACIDQLDEKKREVVVLRLVEGQSNQQIALELEIPANTVAVRYKRALEELRHCLPESVLDEIAGPRVG